MTEDTFGLPETTPDKWTTLELENLIEEAFKAKELADRYQEQSDSHRGRQREIEKSIQSYLEFYGKDKYVAANGTVDVRTKLSFRTPKTEEQKRAYFDALKSRYGEDIYWQQMTVNSVSLNSFLKAEWENALQEGKEFNMPGIESPTEFKTVHLKTGSK